MKHNDAFSRCHPLVNLCYFILVLTMTMVSMHPVLLGLSLAVGLGYTCSLQGKRALRLFLQIVIPAALLTAVCNAAFSHRGVTILWYFPTGNPLTLESILYGLGAGAMLGAVLLWFVCCTEILTTDKLLYLFGRIIPGLALLLSMILRFVPEFSRQRRRIREAQCGLQNTAGAGIREQIRNGLAAFSILVTWALEHAVETADSMKARGFGLPGRTAYSVYRFSGQDAVLLCCECLLGGTSVLALLQGIFSFSYYPVCSGLSAGAFGAKQITGFAVYLLLLLVPLLLNWREKRLWRNTNCRA